MMTGRMFSWFVLVVLFTWPVAGADIITDIGGGTGTSSGGAAPDIRSVDQVTPGPAITPQEITPFEGGVGGWTDAEAPPPEIPQQQPEKKKDQPKPPQPPQMPQKKPQAKKEDKCKLGADQGSQGEAMKSPCSKTQPCGYSSCMVVWNSEGVPACMKYVADKVLYDATPPTIPPGVPNPLKQINRVKADTSGQQCCKARQKAEMAQITVQQNPCVAKLSGALLIGGDLDACKPEMLKTNCEVTGEDQRKELYQDKKYMESLTQKDLPTLKDMVNQGMNPDGSTSIGDLNPDLQKALLSDMKVNNPVIGNGDLNSLAVKADGTLITPTSTISPGTLSNAQSTFFGQTGASITTSSVSGMDIVGGSPANVLSAPNPAYPADMVLTGSDGSVYLTGDQATEFSSFKIDVKPLPSSMNRNLRNRLTSRAFYEPSPFPIRINFFSSDPPMASLFSVNLGKILPRWVKVIPRANAQIDFNGGGWSSFATSVTQGMGIPKGSSLMANPANLGVRTLYTYYIDGLKDYDFLVANGLVLWPLSGTPGGKIISSSFGIPPDQYLSRQQSQMIYG